MHRIMHADRLVLRHGYIGDAERAREIMKYVISYQLIPFLDPCSLTIGCGDTSQKQLS